MGALVLVPAAYVAAWMTAASWIVFVAAAAAIVPLARWIRHATEHLAARAGSAIGGLLNVTFGNIAEPDPGAVRSRRGTRYRRQGTRRAARMPR